MDATGMDRARRLAVTKRQATTLLAAVAVVWVLATVLGHGATWVGYVQATAEASLVGGLADWFAVTALFRRPLRLPIPHTAIIVERKDQFGATLGDFVQQSFLTPEVVIERLRAARVVPRFSAWLSSEANAARVAVSVSDALVELSKELDDQVIVPALQKRVAAIVAEGRHEALVDSILRGLDSYLLANGRELQARLGERPWWLPGAVEDRLVDRLLGGAHITLVEMVGNPVHPLRRDLDAALVRVAGLPQVSEWVAATWADLRGSLPAAAIAPVKDWLIAFGDRLGSDPALHARAAAALETATTFVISHFEGELGHLVSSTVARWDGEETARRLELLLGPDLQYIRINGTVVGALAGLVLWTVSRWLS